jgi:hypothetical protein
MNLKEFRKSSPGLKYYPAFFLRKTVENFSWDSHVMAEFGTERLPNGSPKHYC